MEKLKPCPFCGSKAFVAKIIGINTLYAVFCPADEDYCIKPSTKYYETREEAIARWNKRTNIREGSNGES